MVFMHNIMYIRILSYKAKINANKMCLMPKAEMGSNSSWIFIAFRLDLNWPEMTPDFTRLEENDLWIF